MKGTSEITLINPPEKLRVWAGIAADQSAGVYLFPPLGLMYIQAYIEKMSSYVVDILDGVVGNQDYPEYEEKLKKYNLDLVGIELFNTQYCRHTNDCKYRSQTESQRHHCIGWSSL